MEKHFWIALSASLLAAAVTTVGILVIRRFEDWGRRNSGYFACFAAGVLISVSLMHLFPKALVMTSAAPAWVLAGYWIMHLFNRFLTAHVCDRPDTADYAIGIVPALGIGFHSFVDGAIYSVTFTVSIFTGVLASIGMVLHEFPEGIVTYILLLRSGLRARNAFLWAFFAAALTTPLGMLASYPIVSQLSHAVLGAVLSVSAGALLYVGATHLLPRVEAEPQRYSLVAVGAGVLVALGIVVSG